MRGMVLIAHVNLVDEFFELSIVTSRLESVTRGYSLYCNILMLKEYMCFGLVSLETLPSRSATLGFLGFFEILTVKGPKGFKDTVARANNFTIRA